MVALGATTIPHSAEKHGNRSSVLTESVTLLPALRRRGAAFSAEQNVVNKHLTASGRVMKKALRLAEILQHGMAAHREGRLAEAERSYQAVLEVKRDNFDSLHLLGVVRWQQRRHDEASRLIEQALRVRPDSAEACANLGIVLHSLGRPEEAIAVYDRALATNPRYAKALCHRGDALRALGRHADALASYDKALAAATDYAEAHINRGVVLRDLSRHAEALASFERALALRPGNLQLVYNRANCLQSLGRFAQSLSDYDAVLTANPNSAEAHNNRGCVLEKLGRLDDALASFDAALALRADDADALHNRGNVLLAFARHAEAIESYERALALAPHRVDTLHNRGQALMLLRRYQEALAAFESVLALDPANPSARAALANCRLLTCDWKAVADIAERARAAAQAGDWSRLDPFTALCLSDHPADHLQYARAYLWRQIPVAPQAFPARPTHHGQRIRIAYLSSDFRNHPVARAIVRLFELHDRTRFETVGVSFGPDDASPMRARIAAAFDRFLDVRGKNDREIAGLLHDLEIDIAIDLNGHTQGARPGILAHRPAPIQVLYLGYPGTTGADFIDYLLGDETVLPSENQASCSEKIVQLPHCYHPCDETTPISDREFTRSELGLPEAAPVFCCFNRADKIAAAIFDVWMRLLSGVEGSVLWLSRMHETAQANLRREAAARGVDPDRLVFAPQMASLGDHLARHRQADLFLDTLPYNAHSTAIDALRAGLPVVTCPGHTFAGRVGASLLKAAGLPELITTSLDSYEALALTLASDRPLLESVRHRLLQNRRTCPLFDLERLCRHVEAAYATMRGIYLRGDPPRSFRVEAS
jgi:predicted O-linked N-acetylglucosamine transferase (SPINDLY family)